MAAKLKTDWDAVEPHYCGGLITMTELAKRFNTTPGRICQVAKARGWDRDISEKVRLKTQAKLNKVILNEQNKSLASYNEKLAVEAIATTNVELILRHRTEITRFQGLCDSLLTELESMAMTQEDMLNIAELKAQVAGETDPEAIEAALGSLRKLLRLDNRADTFKKLVEAKTRLVALERQAFGITDKDEGKEQAPVQFFLNMAPGSTAQFAMVDGKPVPPAIENDPS